jgi:hypothetical protein
MKKIVIFLLVASLFPTAAIARKSTYVVTNHRLNYVEIMEVKPKEAEQRQMTHPKDIDEGQMRAILKSIKLSRGQLLSKEIDTQDAFNESSINYLAPALVKAFREARPIDEVIISYLIKDPVFIIRNDRVNIANAWVHENELHLKFQKLYAKVTGDIDKKGDFGEAVSRARGLKIEFDLQPGQTIGDTGTDELVIDINHNFGTDIATVAAVPEPEKKEGKKKGKEKVVQQEAQPQPVATQAQPSNVQGRLEQLEDLRKKNLITEKEYKEKKKEILKDL